MTERLQEPTPRVLIREWTVAEYARREQVTERTVWAWIAKGAVDVRKTPGGGVRVVERVQLH